MVQSDNFGDEALAASEKALVRWLLANKPDFIIAPDGYIPNSIVRKPVYQKIIHEIRKKVQIGPNNQQQQQQRIKIDPYLKDMDPLHSLHLARSDQPMTDLSSTATTEVDQSGAQIDLNLRSHLRPIRRRLKQETNDNILVHRASSLVVDGDDGSKIGMKTLSINSANAKLGDTLTIQTIRDEYNLQVLSNISLAPAPVIPLVQPGSLSEDTTSIVDDSLTSSSSEWFAAALGRLVTSSNGSLQSAYALVASFLQGHHQSTRDMLEKAIGGHLTKFLDLLMRPANLLPYLATLNRSRQILRQLLLNGDLHTFDQLAMQVDNQEAVSDLIAAFHGARRRALVLIQACIPIKESAQRLVDALFDGRVKGSSLVNSIYQRVLGHYNEWIGFGRRELINELDRCVALRYNANDKDVIGQTLLNSKLFDVDFVLPWDPDRPEQSAYRQLHHALVSNKLIRDTLYVIFRNQAILGLLESSHNDYANLISNGPLFAADDLLSPNDKLIVGRFKRYLTQLPHLLAWELIKDPIGEGEGQSSLTQLELALDNWQLLARNARLYIEQRLASSPSSLNVAELVQKSVEGQSQSLHLLAGLLESQIKLEYMLTVLRAGQGKVVDLILRYYLVSQHCDRHQRLVNWLKSVRSELTTAVDVNFIDSLIRLAHKLNQLAEQHGVAKAVNDIRAALITRSIRLSLGHLLPADTLTCTTGIAASDSVDGSRDKLYKDDQLLDEEAEDIENKDHKQVKDMNAECFDRLKPSSPEVNPSAIQPSMESVEELQPSDDKMTKKAKRKLFKNGERTSSSNSKQDSSQNVSKPQLLKRLKVTKTKAGPKRKIVKKSSEEEDRQRRLENVAKFLGIPKESISGVAMSSGRLTKQEITDITRNYRQQYETNHVSSNRGLKNKVPKKVMFESQVEIFPQTDPSQTTVLTDRLEKNEEVDSLNLLENRHTLEDKDIIELSLPVQSSVSKDSNSEQQHDDKLVQKSLPKPLPQFFNRESTTSTTDFLAEAIEKAKSTLVQQIQIHVKHEHISFRVQGQTKVDSDSTWQLYEIIDQLIIRLHNDFSAKLESFDLPNWTRQRLGDEFVKQLDVVKRTSCRKLQTGEWTLQLPGTSSTGAKNRSPSSIDTRGMYRDRIGFDGAGRDEQDINVAIESGVSQPRQITPRLSRLVERRLYRIDHATVYQFDKYGSGDHQLRDTGFLQPIESLNERERLVQTRLAIPNIKSTRLVKPTSTVLPLGDTALDPSLKCRRIPRPSWIPPSDWAKLTRCGSDGATAAVLLCQRDSPADRMLRLAIDRARRVTGGVSLACSRRPQLLDMPRVVSQGTLVDIRRRLVHVSVF